MQCQRHTCVYICKKIPSRTLVIPRTCIRKEVVFYFDIPRSDSEKADTQFSVPRVHCPEERSKAKEVENYQYTSVPMGIRLKLFCAQLFRLISSVSTEQSQICVKNVKSAMLEQGDSYWQDNLAHCLCQV